MRPTRSVSAPTMTLQPREARKMTGVIARRVLLYGGAVAVLAAIVHVLVLVAIARNGVDGLTTAEVYRQLAAGLLGPIGGGR